MNRYRVSLSVVLVALIVPLTVAAEYRVALGSFTEPEHAAQFQEALGDEGYLTVSESVVVGGTRYTRVLYAYIFDTRADAVTALVALTRSRVVHETGINNLWILPGGSSGTEVSSAGASSTVAPSPATAGSGPGSASGAPPAPAAAAVSPAAASASGYRVIDREGYANCIFATAPIGLGEEASAPLTDRIVAPDPIYARCYLPEPIGPIEGENFRHELWIDGKLRSRTFFNEPPEPEWDQIQIWVSEDEYADQINALGPGEHEIIIWVMKNESHGERAVAGTNAAGEIVAGMEEIWIPVRLSKGSVTYVVE
ncbi:MAG: SPOR domain-containing protein [Alkalispirochaeta sp.]